MTQHRHTFRRLGGAAIVAVMIAAGVAGAAAAAPSPHASLVPQTPATGYPIVLNTPTYNETNVNCPRGCQRNREVLAADQVGRHIVTGGNFYELELRDGTVAAQKFFAAWNVDTKLPVCLGTLTFDDEVRAVAAGPTATKVYVAGRFSKVTGADGVIRSRSRVALVDLADCSVDRTFIPSGANGRVDELAIVGTRMFVGGEFTAFGGQAIETLAELNATTGAVAASFNFATANEYNGRVKGLAVNPAGTRLIVAGRFGTMSRNGVSVVAPTAVIDITDPAAPALTPHSSSGYVSIADLLDASIAPDASSVGLAFGTATISDYVYLTPLTEAAVTPRWSHFMRDSTFGIAVTNNAVYVGGHFCRPDAGPGVSALMSPQMGLDTCTGSINYTGGVWRSHLAALDLADGTPLEWNPGQDSFTGAQRLTMTTRGLLVGFDGGRINNIRTGALGFFDFGPTVEDTTPPSNVTYSAPTAGATIDNAVTVAGSATDNIGVAKFTTTVQASDGRWLLADGTLGATAATFTTTAQAGGTFSRQFVLPAGTFTVRTRAVDVAGLKSAQQTAVTFVASGKESELPIISLAEPAAKLAAEKAFVVSAPITDNLAVASAVVAVRDSAGLFLQPDRTYAATPVWTSMSASVGAFNTKSVTARADLGRLVRPGALTVTVRATDSSGNSSEISRAVEVTLAGSVVPTGTLTDPPATVGKDTAPTIRGTAADNVIVDGIQLTVANAAGQFVRADGTLGAEVTPLTPTVTGLGTASATYQLALPKLPESTYKVRATITDWLGNVAIVERSFTVVGDVPAVLSATAGGLARGPETVGYTFTVSAATTVSALGIYDANGDGVLNNPAAARIAIWQQSTRAQVASTTVPTNATAEGRFFYGALATPVTLQPGTTYVIGYETFSNGEQHATSATVTNDAAVTITGWALNSFFQGFGSWGYPSFQGGGSPKGVPGFKIRR